MPFNASGQSFAPLSVLKVLSPAVLESVRSYTGLTTAQCQANGSLSSQSVTSSGATIEVGKVRTAGIMVVVPTDQPQVTFGNQSPLSGTTAAQPIVAIPAVNTFNDQITQSGGAPSSSGFAVPPGNAILLNPFNDPLYAITASGISSTVFWMDPSS